MTSADDAMELSPVTVADAGEVLTTQRAAFAPDLAGSGIGRALLEVAEANSGAREAELFTGSLSEANIRLYERCGYIETQRVPQGDGIEEIYMRKQLGAGSDV